MKILVLQVTSSNYFKSLFVGFFFSFSNPPLFLFLSKCLEASTAMQKATRTILLSQCLRL